jgi:hypothetical protein
MKLFFTFHKMWIWVYKAYYRRKSQGAFEMIETTLSFLQLVRLSVVLVLAVGLAPLLVYGHSWFQAVKRRREQRLQSSRSKTPDAAVLGSRRLLSETRSERQTGQELWIADRDGVEVV